MPRCTTCNQYAAWDTEGVPIYIEVRGERTKTVDEPTCQHCLRLLYVSEELRVRPPDGPEEELSRGNDIGG